MENVHTMNTFCTKGTQKIIVTRHLITEKNKPCRLPISPEPTLTEIIIKLITGKE